MNVREMLAQERGNFVIFMALKLENNLKRYAFGIDAAGVDRLKQGERPSGARGER